MWRFCLLAAVAVGGCVVLCPSELRAVINADNPGSATPDNTAQPAGLPQWDNVGIVNGDTGIYIGNGWVLTAGHVGVGNINLGGTIYDWNGQSRNLYNPDGSTADLAMFQLSSLPAGLSQLNISNTSPVVGATFYNVGNGVARNTAEEYFTYDPTSQTFTQTDNPSAPYQGFGYGSTNALSWGQNTVQGTASYSVGSAEVNAFYAIFSSTTDQIIFGDSGGGVFNDNGTLIGVNDAIDYLTIDGADVTPPNTVLFGDTSYMIDLALFYDQIAEISGVPEPSSLTLLALGGFALLGRRRRTG